MATPIPAAAPEACTGTRDLRRTGLHPDFWYPLARSRDLGRGKALGVTFAGDPIVLVRTASGAVFALEDRCAHRQVPLHAGVVAGEEIRCTYHGWTYDCAGRCVNVPYLDRGRTLPNGVRGYPCHEAYGFVFVFTGDPARAGEVTFPDVPSFADPRYRTRYLDRRVACHYSFMHENLMDMNHQFLHRRVMGGIRATLTGTTSGPGWIEAEYTFARVKGKQPVGERFMIGAARANAAKGGRDRMTIRTGYPYQTLRYFAPGAERPALDLWNVYVPVDAEQRANHTFGLMMIRRPPIPGLIHVLWPFIIWFTERIFAEDRWIVEREQEAFDRQGADRNQEIFPLILGLREVLRDNGVALDEARGA